MEKKAKEILEQYGIYEVYSEKGNILTWYSYFGEGFYKVTRNIKTKKETRKLLRYKNPPKFLKTKEGYTRYNYYTG